MVIGLEIFKKYFKAYQDCYLIIGGTACDLILTDAGLNPRATKDIDIILIVEAIESAFIQRFWEFIKEGGYQIKQKELENKNCYRFGSPQTSGFPKQIELFSRTPDLIDLKEDMHLTPIPTEEGLSSLSAILLDEAYYHFTITHSDKKGDIHFAKPHSLICLKAYAYLSNKARQEAGQHVHKVDIDKHKYDVFRMVLILNPDDIFEIPEIIQSDLQKFADAVKTNLPDPAIFKENGFGTQDMEAIFAQFVKSFKLNV